MFIYMILGKITDYEKSHYRVNLNLGVEIIFVYLNNQYNSSFFSSILKPVINILVCFCTHTTHAIK